MAEKVLVIDDDAEFAELIKLLLSKKGYEAVVALSGEEGVELARRISPAVILQDFMLPDISGGNLLKRLKEISPDTHVIIITARGSEDVAVEIMKAGATDYLKKPFDSEKLLTTIENVLKLRSSESALDRLNNELSYQNQQFLAVNAISNVLISTMPREERYRTVAGIILKNMRADMVNIFRYDDSKALKIVVSDGLADIKDCNLARGVGLASYVTEVRKPAVVANFRNETRFKLPEEVGRLGLVSGLAAPMLVKDGVKGVVAVYNTQSRVFTPFEIKLLGNYANLIALGMENDRMAGILASFQSQWQVTLDAVPDRITLQDLEHRVIMANKAAAREAGLDVKDVIGHKCSWVFHTIKEPIAGCPVEEVIKTKAAVYRELRAGNPEELLKIWGYPILDGDGELMMVVEYVKKEKAQAS